ncbi:ActS/PrrB/RegB family redox-sensitive histidine kinase [Cognatishimia sp. SS12]|uniref:sensor histidine kinase RegB n=1 Tax=Cognatishimia sp. SS12 TaxID=2979465 RepID=UPI00232C9333|nr:ActS/PrrB/RegB family redox-sensitive histidine kinase [Cognatishimia sp. SS12]MDC0737762.1 ActS/PrrB/RegB family redox-sensitive histidine kinase [Cognatishimia sp. SS12]
MTELSSDILSGQMRSNWIRLRTIITVRWIAIIGQIIALLIAQFLFQMQLNYLLCYLAVAVSMAGNIAATLVFPENKLLSETENAAMLLFDILQLCFLLFLTGGLNNPFSILIVGPVTISAASLSVPTTVTLGSVATVLISLMTHFHLPLRSEQGVILGIPDIFLYGNLAGILIAIVFSSLYARRVVSEMSSMSEALAATQMALAREQKLTDLGGVVAAAAHELGTPLATIKLTSGELMEELTDQPELYDDAALIKQQADRCRDILRSMGRAGKDDLQLRRAPLLTLIEEAAEPHLNRGKNLNFNEDITQSSLGNVPIVLRRPEIIHGLRNLVQNAVDFAKENVWVETDWTNDTITIRIMDDGRGFPAHVIGRIGNPFVGTRRGTAERKQRPGYEGMGLGLFIAKTLLERTGARLSFSNGTRLSTDKTTSRAHRGAIAEVTWPRHRLEVAADDLPLRADNPIFS